MAVLLVQPFSKSMPTQNQAKSIPGWVRADVVLLALGIGLLLWLIGGVLLLIFAGVLLAIALNGLSSALARRTRSSYGWSLLAVTLGLFLLLLAAFLVIVPPFLQELGEIVESVTAFIGQAEETLQQYPWLEEILGFGTTGDTPLPDPGELAGRFATFTMSVFGAIGAVFIVAAIGVFVAARPNLYRDGLIKLVPKRSRPRAAETLNDIGYGLRWWLLGQLVSMVVLGTATSIGLYLIGVNVWLGLGVLVGLLTFVPFLGPILAGIPVVLIGFAGGLEMGIAVLVLYLVLQNLEGYVITPLIQQEAIHLPPALLLAVQVLMATLYGVYGLILAAPLAVAGMVAVKRLYIEDVLGDRVSD
jgi:predicted PurR-regulated permease PerM